MSSATQGMFLILSAILLVLGLSDLAEQYKQGEELKWIYPLVLIGCGAGLPLVIFPISAYLEDSSFQDSESENVSSYDTNSDGGFDGGGGD